MLHRGRCSSDMLTSMRRKRNRVIFDFFLILVSIGVAVYIVETGAVHAFAASLASLEWAGAFFAGMLFTSLFTTAPAIAILGELVGEQSVVSVALIGALGAVVGDFILFQLVRDRVGADIRFLLGYTKHRRFPAIFKTRLFHSLTPFVGALIIASPLPDELGLALLGFSKVPERSFIFITYAMNALGILLIGWVAVTVQGPL